MASSCSLRCVSCPGCGSSWRRSRLVIRYGNGVDRGYNPKVLAIPEVMGPDQLLSYSMSLSKSRAVAEEVVEKLQLYTPQPAKPIPQSWPL